MDEARTPLIISGPLDDRSDFYNTIDAFIPKLDKADYEVDEKQRTVNLSEVGMSKLEQVLRDARLLKSESLYDVENVSVVHHVNQALRAHKLFQRDKDYIVRNGEVVIIDEFTGRMMPGRRYSEGLHQALEAKEHQPIQPENQTLASITFQNYFRMYEKLAGMTGTALTEADEFLDIYGLDVVEVPTNMPMVRDDQDDEVYRTNIEKYRAILALITECKSRGQPVLVGTTSIEKSEQLAELLAQGRLGAARLLRPQRVRGALLAATTGPPRPRCSRSSTRATTSRRPTSCRRRGCRARSRSPPTWRAAAPTSSSAATPTCGSATSLPTSRTCASANAIRAPTTIRKQVARLKEKALAAGGLFVLGTERHESRRIDNQLRGRSGRQGDPGRSKFFLSLEDDLMRIFGSDKLDGMLQKLGLRRTRRSSIPGSTRRWRRRSRRSRRATSTSARTSSSSTTS